LLIKRRDAGIPLTPRPRRGNWWLENHIYEVNS
jgi:hypothetical protein